MESVSFDKSDIERRSGIGSGGRNSGKPCGLVGTDVILGACDASANVFFCCGLLREFKLAISRLAEAATSRLSFFELPKEASINQIPIAPVARTTLAVARYAVVGSLLRLCT